MRKKFAKNILLGFTMMLTGIVNAQVDVKKLSKVEREDLLISKLYVILRDQDLNDKDLFEAVVKEAWTLTPVSVISFDEYKRISEKENSVFFAVRGYNNSYSKKIDKFDYVGKKVIRSHVCLDLWRNLSKDNSDRLDQFVLAKIHINAFGEMGRDLMMQEFKEKNNDMIFEYLHKNENAGVSEWKPGFIKNYLQRLNYLLEKKAEVHHLEKMVDKGVMGKVIQDTLYLDTDLTIGAPYKALSKYKYPYAFISRNEINKKILNGDKFYYMMHYQNSEYSSSMAWGLITVKEIVIINSSNGKCSLNVIRVDQHFDGYIEDNFFKRIAEYTKRNY
jgi:hypothetical protein